MQLETKMTFTMGTAYNEFGYNQYPAIMSRFLCIKIIDCNVKHFSYNHNEQFLLNLLPVSGTEYISKFSRTLSSHSLGELFQ